MRQDPVTTFASLASIGSAEPGTGAITFRVVGAAATGTKDDLVARLRSGNPAALGEAYDAHHVPLRAFAARLLGDASAAEDLVQETFLALPRAIVRFRGESSLLTFVIGIAVRHASHHVRAAARRRRAMERLAREPERRAPAPDEQTDRRRLAELLLRALDTLPEDQRVAIVLCEVEGRTSAEAAEIVGVPEGTVRTRLFHARRKLALQLAEEQPR